VRSLFLQFSVLIGALTLANRIAGEATATETALAALGAATAMYIVLVVGDIVVQRAVDYLAPAPPEAIPAARPSADASAAPSVETPSALAA
jgi:hypothetical protein